MLRVTAFLLVLFHLPFLAHSLFLGPVPVSGLFTNGNNAQHRQGVSHTEHLTPSNTTRVGVVSRSGEHSTIYPAHFTSDDPASHFNGTANVSNVPHGGKQDGKDGDSRSGTKDDSTTNLCTKPFFFSLPASPPSLPVAGDEQQEQSLKPLSPHAMNTTYIPPSSNLNSTLASRTSPASWSACRNLAESWAKTNGAGHWTLDATQLWDTEMWTLLAATEPGSSPNKGKLDEIATPDPAVSQDFDRLGEHDREEESIGDGCVLIARFSESQYDATGTSVGSGDVRELVRLILEEADAVGSVSGQAEGEFVCNKGPGSVDTKVGWWIRGLEGLL